MLGNNFTEQLKMYIPLHFRHLANTLLLQSQVTVNATTEKAEFLSQQHQQPIQKCKGALQHYLYNKT